MTGIIDKLAAIYQENPQQCDLCGKIAELRPYGPNGEAICFECGMKDEATTQQQFVQVLRNAVLESMGRKPADEYPTKVPDLFVTYEADPNCEHDFAQPTTRADGLKVVSCTKCTGWFCY
jgi:hypothetical protein